MPCKLCVLRMLWCWLRRCRSGGACGTYSVWPQHGRQCVPALNMSTQWPCLGSQRRFARSPLTAHSHRLTLLMQPQHPQGCSSTEPNGTCTSCSSGHGLSGGACKRCTAANCDACNDALDKCTSCTVRGIDLVLVNGTCVPVRADGTSAGGGLLCMMCSCRRCPCANTEPPPPPNVDTDAHKLKLTHQPVPAPAPAASAVHRRALPILRRRTDSLRGLR